MVACALAIVLFATLAAAAKEQTSAEKTLFEYAMSVPSGQSPLTADMKSELMTAVRRRASTHAEELEAKDEQGRTPLHAAAIFGMPAVVEALLVGGAKDKHACLHAGDGKGRMPLHLAVQSMSISKEDAAEKIEILVRHGARADALDGEGVAALHIASQNAFVPAIQALSRAGADLNVLAGPQHTPLHLAAIVGEPASIRALAAVGANLNAQDLSGYTALHVAILKSNPTCVRALAKVGADLEVRANLGDGMGNGATALQVAVKLNCLECVRELVAAGADIHTEANGMTPLEIAGTDEEMLRALTRTVLGSRKPKAKHGKQEL